MHDLLCSDIKLFVIFVFIIVFKKRKYDNYKHFTIPYFMSDIAPPFFFSI